MRHHTPKGIPFYIHISCLFIALLIGFALVSDWSMYRAMNAMLKQAAEQQFKLVLKSTRSEIEHIFQSGQQSVLLMEQQPLMNARSLDERLLSLPYLTTSLKFNPAIIAHFIGYETGDYFLVRIYRGSQSIAERFTPPPGTRWIVQSISQVAGSPRGEYLFYDEKLILLERRIDPAYHFDPRSRSWYQAKNTPGQVFVSAPYVFVSSLVAGMTFSKQTPDFKGVIGSDIRLDRLNELLLQHKATPDTRMVLLSGDERVIASHKGAPRLQTDSHGVLQLPSLSSFDAPVLHKFLAAQPNHSANMAGSFVSEDGGQWEGLIQHINLPGMNPLTLVIASPHQELLAAAHSERNRSLFISAILILFGLIFAIWLSRKASRPLNALSTEVQKIEQFKFNEPVQIKTNITEIARLAHALDEMKSTISRFMDLSLALAAESDFNRLLARILEELSDVSGAEGGVIYMTEATSQHLEAAQIRWQGVSAAQSDNSQIIDLKGGHPVALALDKNQILDTLDAHDFNVAFPLLPGADKPLILLTLPLRNQEGALVGVMALAIDKNKAPGADLLTFIETISASAAVAINTQRLINEQKNLLEAFIQLIAGAIDAKSPYTGGHCQRVPELTKMLARAAEKQTTGPFAGFALSADQWEELHIAAWLHDCGKVTTPEYVVDKATKLETLYDRIHEVRMRFEVLKRDAEITCWQSIAAGGPAAELKAGLALSLAELDDDFAFVASCNEGGEFMAPDKIARLQLIAARCWQRTLSDRIGISHEENSRKARSPEAALPVTEPLLADKPEHIQLRSSRDTLAPGNPWGFKVSVPEAMYNRGELYNLSVARGTLAAEERYKINEHIIQTIIMLEKLPFPRHLQRVPEIAGGHHEKMDGTGYPRQLKRSEMSIPARMMAIADIFEALTAIDRPYKKGKTLSEAIRIMSFMVKDQHIDPEIFELFLREHLHLEYAARFMLPEQIDEVDLSAYLVN